MDVTDNTQISGWVSDQLLKVMRTHVTTQIVRNGWPILGLSAYTPDIEKTVIPAGNEQLATYGVSLVRMGNFDVNLSDDDEATLKGLAKDTAYSRLAGSFNQYAAGEMELGAGEGMSKGGGCNRRRLPRGRAGLGRPGGRTAAARAPAAAGTRLRRRRRRVLAGRAARAVPPRPAPSSAPTATPTNPAGDKFCASCGTSLAPPTVTCANCQPANPVGAKFCVNCGQPLAAAPVAVRLLRHRATCRGPLLRVLWHGRRACGPSAAAASEASGAGDGPADPSAVELTVGQEGQR